MGKIEKDDLVLTQEPFGTTYADWKNRGQRRPPERGAPPTLQPPWSWVAAGMPVGFWRLRQNTARSAVGAAAESVLHSHRFDDLVGLGAKMVARDGVEIGAGDAITQAFCGCAVEWMRPDAWVCSIP
jgi:hypothetical protein